jgi:plasmid stability protein
VAVNLSIKNVPEGLVDQLRARAKRNHRSLQGELMVILEEALGQRRRTPAEVYQQVRELGLKTPAEAVAIVRQDRDAR